MTPFFLKEIEAPQTNRKKAWGMLNHAVTEKIRIEMKESFEKKMMIRKYFFQNLLEKMKIK